jgi:uncharacterized membrane protein (DUF106 family)
MMDGLVYVVVWLNAVANALGRVLLAPIAVLPGWLSATIAAAATGVVFLAIFKYTSNQRAIKRVKDDIKANLLAVKLFKDSILVTLSAQGQVFLGAFRLFVLALVPMAVMMVPALLILGQLALWYQARPLRVGEAAVVTATLTHDDSSDFATPEIRLQPNSSIEVATGPVHVLSKREICWKIVARENGYHNLLFQAGEQTAEKGLAIGDHFMRVGTEKPKWSWSDVLLNPDEPPFGPDSLIQSIEIEYPQRSSWTCGTDTWVIYWFVVSMIAALCCRRLLNVNI